MSEAPATVETAGHAGTAEHHEPTLLGLGAEGWVYTSITIFFVVAFVVGKLHKKITDALDGMIAEKRRNLDEAAQIRAEAEALLADARARHEASAKDAAALLDHARAEAGQIIAQAEKDTGAMIERRAAMAEAKIAAAERAAADALRREAAGAAAAAAGLVIADSHDAAADGKLADAIISGI